MGFLKIVFRLIFGVRPTPRPPIEVREDQTAVAVFIDAPNVKNVGWNMYGAPLLINPEALSAHLREYIGQRTVIFAGVYERIYNDSETIKRWIQLATRICKKYGFTFIPGEPGKNDIDSYIGVDMLHAAAEARAKGFTRMRFILLSGDGIYRRAFASLLKAHPDLKSELVVFSWESAMNLELIRLATKHGSTHLLEEWPDIVRGLARKRKWREKEIHA